MWIAAASKMPTDEEIIECENMYKNYYCGKYENTECFMGAYFMNEATYRVSLKRLYKILGEIPEIKS